MELVIPVFATSHFQRRKVRCFTGSVGLEAQVAAGSAGHLGQVAFNVPVGDATPVDRPLTRGGDSRMAGMDKPRSDGWQVFVRAVGSAEDAASKRPGEKSEIHVNAHQ